MWISTFPASSASGNLDGDIQREHQHVSPRTALTQTEARIAELVADGLSNREIADRLGLGVKTVETHLSHVFRKLGIHSRAELRSGSEAM
jgi:DNA-binding CsgD family transcriptional regulator